MVSIRLLLFLFAFSLPAVFAECFEAIMDASLCVVTINIHKKNTHQGYKVMTGKRGNSLIVVVARLAAWCLCATVMSTKQEGSGYKDVDTDLHRSDDNEIEFGGFVNDQMKTMTVR